VKSNDQLLATKKDAKALAQTWAGFTVSLPVICFEEFMRRQESDHPNSGESISWTFLHFLQNQTNLTSSTVDIFLGNELVLINTTELDEWMEHCGDAAEPLVQVLMKQVREAAIAATGNLTFNWIRCHPNTGGGIAQPYGGIKLLACSESDPGKGIEIIRPEAQKEYYTCVWNADQEQLYFKFLEENLQNNITWEIAKVDAFSRSLKEASGAEGCTHNAPASGTSTVGP
jgi:hypothetical protein